MIDANGRQLKSISMRDPARIQLAIQTAKDETLKPEDRMIEIFTEAVVPLLADLRTLIVEVVIPMLNTQIEQNNLHTQILSESLKLQQASMNSRLLKP